MTIFIFLFFIENLTQSYGTLVCHATVVENTDLDEGDSLLEFSLSFSQHWLSELEIFATLFAAAIHDFEHTGTTNNFHVQTR